MGATPPRWQVWGIGLALLLASCSGTASPETSRETVSPTVPEPSTTAPPAAATSAVTTEANGEAPYVAYETALHLALTMVEAGYGCAEAERQNALGDESTTAEVVSAVSCMWPTEEDPDLPEDRIAVLVFHTERARLLQTASVFVFGCAALPSLPATLSYAYGENWAVMTDYGETGPTTMQALADDLGGYANEVGCSDLEAWLSSLEGDPSIESPDDLTFETLKEGLGEPQVVWRASPAEPVTIEASDPDAGLGQQVKDGDFEFVVGGFECGVGAVRDSPGGTADGQFCILELTITNVGAVIRKYSFGDQVLVDDGGVRYPASYWGTVSMEDGDALEDLEPGAQLRTPLVFDVPAHLDTESLVLVELHQSLLSSGVLVHLD